MCSSDLLLLTFAFVSTSYVTLNQVYENAQYMFELSILIEAAGLSLALAYKQKESEIKLQQNRLLFQELSHRIQNGLQQIISILTLQISTTKEETVKIQLEDTVQRIASISLIHKTLQHSKSVGKINMQDYLESFLGAYQQLNGDIEFTLECSEDIELEIKQLTPLALVINELITNSIKHAFPNQKEKQISLRLQGVNTIKLVYEDNGVGYDETAVSPSVGSKLMRTLSKVELKGKVANDTAQHYYFSLEFDV